MAVYSDDSHHQKSTPPRRAGTAKRTQTRAIVFMGFALFAGLAAAWMVTHYISGTRSSANVQMTKVAVASMDIPLATTLRPELVTFIDWPTGAIPTGTM